MRICLLSLVLLAACGGSREPGPQASEYGAVTFWEVTALSGSVTSCTDAPDYASATEPPELDENSFLIYRVSEDGSSATSMPARAARAWLTRLLVDRRRPRPAFAREPVGGFAAARAVAPRRSEEAGAKAELQSSVRATPTSAPGLSTS